MGRRRWMVAGAVLFALAIGGRALGDIAALFPASLYTFVAATGPIRAEHFNQLGAEVAAIEARLGANLSRVPTVHSSCLRIELPQPEERFPTAWRAPKAGVLRGVTCETGGVNSEVYLHVLIDDGTPAFAVSLHCTNTIGPLTVPTVSGAMALGDRLDLEFGEVIGAAEWVSACLEFEPGT